MHIFEIVPPSLMAFEQLTQLVGILVSDQPKGCWKAIDAGAILS